MSFSREHLNLLAEFKDPEDPKFSNTAMMAAVAAKKARRVAKGLNFTCFVIDDDDNTGAGNTLDNFLQILQAEQAVISQAQRFQFVYRNSTHWLAGTVGFYDGIYHFYIIDGIELDFRILEVQNNILKYLPDSKILWSVLSIQSDSKNCGTFALDHAYCLSKMPDPHTLELKLEQKPGSSDQLDITKNPEIFGKLIRLIQKPKFTAKSFEVRKIQDVKFAALSSTNFSYTKLALSEFKVNATDTILHYLLRKNSPVTLYPSRPFFCINTVAIKRNSIKIKTLQHLKALSETELKQLSVDNLTLNSLRAIPSEVKTAILEKKHSAELSCALSQVSFLLTDDNFWGGSSKIQTLANALLDQDNKPLDPIAAFAALKKIALPNIGRKSTLYLLFSIPDDPKIASFYALFKDASDMSELINLSGFRKLYTLQRSTLNIFGRPR